ncbi:MAG TPA: hypothetical protein VIC27_08095 [Ktedonobacterales bacterium]
MTRQPARTTTRDLAQTLVSDPVPESVAARAQGAEPAATAAPPAVIDAAPDEAPDDASLEEESTPTTPVRKMPTLAVMAALAPRADPSPSETADTPDGADVRVSPEDTAPRARAVHPTAPLAEADRLDLAALEFAADASAADEPPTDEGAASRVDAPISAALADALATPDDAPALDTQGLPAASTSNGMWWTQAVRRRPAPETRPIAAAVRPGAPDPDDAEVTAPRPVARRPFAAPAVPAQAERQAKQSEDELFSRRARSTGARLRARAMRSPRVIVLSWTAGGHVAVACVAALIAVIAALRSSAGPDALAVFEWALALALIAGVGAAVGYACAQIGRPRLATLALALSQLGALTWALGLLGPRAALLTLAPASAALALRGAGRLSAVAAALGWMTFFIVAEALTLSGALTPSLALSGVGAALVDVALPLVGLWLAVSILNSLYVSRLNVVARGRAVEHAALLTEAQLDRLRTQTEDDADALRRALGEALRGEQPERVYARGALSVVADEVNAMADRLIDLRYDRAERKRLESATRRLTRVIERAWLGLSWSWPDATGTILDDLLALLRTPPPPDTPDLLDDTTPTGQVVAPHLFRGWQVAEPDPTAQRTQPGLPSLPSIPSAPSLPSLWPSDPGLGLTDPLELPPSPRWRSPEPLLDPSDRPESPNR